MLRVAAAGNHFCGNLLRICISLSVCSKKLNSNRNVHGKKENDFLF